MQNAQDAVIIESVLKGRVQDFDILVGRYQGRIEGFITKFFRSQTHTADLTQEVFLTAYLDLAKLRTTERFKSWLYGIAYRKCLHISRRHKTETKAVQQMSKQTDQTVTAPTEPVDPTEQSRTLNLLNSLSQLDALLVWLHYIEELPYDEVAELVDMNSAAIRQRCRRALVQLRGRQV